MPLNIVMIGAMGTAAGGAALTTFPVAHVNAAGCSLIVLGTLIYSRHSMMESIRPRLDQIYRHSKRSSDLNREQVELLHDMKPDTNSSGPNTLPPPPLRRIV